MELYAIELFTTTETIIILNLCILGKERKIYGEGYHIVWAFYESTYVNEKVEHYSFTFDNLIFSIGGNLGLFLGWSLKSLVLDFIEFLYPRMKKKILNLCTKCK